MLSVLGKYHFIVSGINNEKLIRAKNAKETKRKLQ